VQLEKIKNAETALASEPAPLLREALSRWSLALEMARQWQDRRDEDAFLQVMAVATQADELFVKSIRQNWEQQVAQVRAFQQMLRLSGQFDKPAPAPIPPDEIFFSG